jgi:hypothetical protein
MSDTTRNAGRTQAERRADRQDRIDTRANRLRGDASAQFRRADQISERFYGGQPILVGHHSEKGARRDHARMDNAMRNGIALSDAASAVASVTPSTAVLATDSDGAEIMQARIEKAEAQQAQWKAINALVRKGDRAALAAMGLGETTIKELFTPQWGDRGPIGMPAYLLTNNNANIRRMRLRLAELQRATKLEFKERTVGDVRVIEDPDTMRIRLHFPGKPSPAVIAILKMHAFRWAPSERAWQRQLNGSGRMHADLVLHAIESAGG